MSNSERTLLDEINDFLEAEREIYGDFMLPLPNNTDDSETVPEEQNIVREPEPSVPYVSEANLAGKELTLQQKLEACATLDALCELCEQADELKTDLANTNLVFGVGNPNADLMLIGEAPGEQEDRQGEPFVGAAGQLLNKILAAINFEREDVYIANILKHRPPGNRNPNAEECQRSFPYLMRQIELIEPKLILCLGRVSGNAMLGRDDSLKNMRSHPHTFQGIELHVTYHPAALLRNPQWKRPTWGDVQAVRKRYDELGGKP